MHKAILYTTCNTHPPEIETQCRLQLRTAGLPIFCVSREPTDFGDRQAVVRGSRSALTLHRQLVTGLRLIEAEVTFVCENDVLYHPSHFEFTPARRDTFYYNTHVYKRWVLDRHTTWTDDLQQISGLCGYTELLLDFFAMRLRQIEQEGDNRHYEPGARYDCRARNWQSEFPNLDLRHSGNFTRSHRQAEDFRNPRYARGFRIVEHVPYWDDLEATHG